MQRFGKKEFLRKIKQFMPKLRNVRCKDCKYKTHPFSEWFEFEYCNYYYTFYHSVFCGNSVIKYRKSYFDAVAGKQTTPFEIRLLSITKCTDTMYGQTVRTNSRCRADS